MKLFNNGQHHISPSILACDFSNLAEKFNEIKSAGINYIHYDVMDNHFVPQLTFGYKFVKDFNKKTGLLSDVHLMIDNPHESVDKYIDAGPDIITFHYEALEHDKIDGLIEKIKSAGIYAGISIKPKTKVSEIEPFLDKLDMILVMTVEPGFAGQKLIPECLDKIDEIKELVEKNNLNVIIQCDGGINTGNIKDLYDRGCRFFVMGSAFFKENDYLEFKKRVDAALLK